jgi:hypothetical protein
MHMPSAAHALAFMALLYLPFSHIVDGIRGCEGLRENLEEVKEMMGTLVKTIIKCTVRP